MRATPDLTRESPGIATLGGEEIEAVEGFWIYRPWLLADGCPAPPPKAPAVPDGEEAEAQPQVEAERQPEPAVRRSRVGIAHFFSKTDSRTGRRDNRSYEATKVLGEGEEPSRQGYNLVLSGRLIKLPGGRVIACRMTDADAPPECVVSAQFDRVWIERPDTGAMIAEWSN